MLGGVARKLRIFGFDTEYMVHSDDGDVLKCGIEQCRVILTADKEFFKRIVKQGVRGVLVDGADDFDDLVHIFKKLGIISVKVSTIRCTLCNHPLEAKSQEQARGMVPASVLVLHDEFYQCRKCGKIYWDGGHLDRIRAFAKKLEGRLATSKG